MSNIIKFLSTLREHEGLKALLIEYFTTSKVVFLSKCDELIHHCPSLRGIQCREDVQIKPEWDYAEIRKGILVNKLNIQNGYYHPQAIYKEYFGKVTHTKSARKLFFMLICQILTLHTKDKVPTFAFHYNCHI